MNIRINDSGDMVIDCDDLLRFVTETQRSGAVQGLACRDDVIRHVMDQVLGGMTEDGYYGSTGDAKYVPFNGVDIFRREIAKMSSGIAKAEIQKLEECILKLKTELDEINAKKWR